MVSKCGGYVRPQAEPGGLHLFSNPNDDTGQQNAMSISVVGVVSDSSGLGPALQCLTLPTGAG